MFHFPVKNAVANLDDVAGELCKLARVTGPEFPPPLDSSRTLPASDWPVPRGGIKDSAGPVSVPCAQKCWSTPPSPPSLHAENCVALPLVIRDLCCKVQARMISY